MGLYLCIFDGNEEVDGVEVGFYSDFSVLREFIASELEGGHAGSKFPTFMLHSDCDGEWSVADCEKLSHELGEIEMDLKRRDPIAFASDWQSGVAESVGLKPRNAFETFIDVDGEFLLDRLSDLVQLALRCRLPILFQ